MRIFVAGATGAVGRLLVPLLVAAGHQVTGSSRTSSGVDQVRSQGADGVLADFLDADSAKRAVRAAAPDAVIHQLTALGGGSLADNARIRIEGTRNLVDAAKRAGVARIVAQSIAWAYEPGAGPAAEHIALDVTAPQPRATSIGGVVALEDAVAEIDTHVVLRYGLLYGPNTWYAPGERIAAQLGAGDLTATDAVNSFVHVHDAAVAATLALHWPSGAVNIVDDEPAPAREWMPALAHAVGAPVPPAAAGGAGWERGADNTLARTGLGWKPGRPSWRTGFATQLE